MNHYVATMVMSQVIDEVETEKDVIEAKREEYLSGQSERVKQSRKRKVERTLARYGIKVEDLNVTTCNNM